MTLMQHDGDQWVRADDVREWLRGLRRGVSYDLGDTTTRARGSDHPEALVQEFDRLLAEEVTNGCPRCGGTGKDPNP
jgi:hypothetical protein